MRDFDTLQQDNETNETETQPPTGTDGLSLLGPYTGVPTYNAPQAEAARQKRGEEKALDAVAPKESDGWDSFYAKFRDNQRADANMELDYGLSKFLRSPDAADEGKAFAYLDDYSAKRWGIRCERGNAWTTDRTPFDNARQYADAMVGILHRGYSAIASPEYNRWMEARESGNREEMMRLAGIDRYERDYSTGGYAAGGVVMNPREKSDDEIDEELKSYNAKIEGQNFVGVLRAYDDAYRLTDEEREMVLAALKHGDGLPQEWADAYADLIHGDLDRAAVIGNLIDLTRQRTPAWWRDNVLDPFTTGFKRFRDGLANFGEEVFAPGLAESLIRRDVGENRKFYWNDAERAEYSRLYDRYKSALGFSDAAESRATKVVDGMCARRLRLEAMPRERQIRERRERLMLEDALMHKPGAEYAYWERAIAGAVSTLPYMATLAIPYAGFAANVATQFEEVRDEIIMNGGDPDEAVGAQAVLAVAWAGIEKLQMEGLFGRPLTGLQRKTLLTHVFETSMKDGKIGLIGKYLAGASKEAALSAVKESVEEGLQDALEGAEREWFRSHDGAKTLDALVTQGWNGFYESLGTMGILGGFGAFKKSVTANRDSLSNESIADYAAKELKGLNVFKNRLMPADGRTLDENEEEKLGKRAKAMMDDCKRIADGHSQDGSGLRAALDEISEKYGLDEEKLRPFGDYLDLRRNLLDTARRADSDADARAIAAIAGGAFRIGNDTTYDPEDLITLLSPNATVETVEIDDPFAKPAAPAESEATQRLREELANADRRIAAARVGSERRAAERDRRRIAKRLKASEARDAAAAEHPKATVRRVTIPVGKSGETRSFTIVEQTDAPDVHTRGFAASVAEAMRGAVGRKNEDGLTVRDGAKMTVDEFLELPSAERGATAVTEDQYMALSPAERESYLGANKLKTGGDFRILDATGREVFGSDAMVSVMRAFNSPHAAVGGNYTLAHEYGHALTSFARELGLVDDATAAVMRRLFGDPRRGVDELWNEEAASNGFSEYLRGEYDFKRYTPEERRAAMNLFERIWDVIKAIFRLNGYRPPVTPHERTRREEALDAAYEAIRSGDFAGLSVYAGIDFAEDAEGKKPSETKKSEAGNDADAAERMDGFMADEPETEQPHEAERAEKTAGNHAAPQAETRNGASDGGSEEFRRGFEAALREAAANPAGAAAQPVRTGTKFTVLTPDYQMSVEAEPMWTPLASLRESTGDREVQMRDRSREASDEQTLRMSRPGVFYPLALFPGTVSDRGAPIVGGGLNIISGHGRKRALEAVAAEGRFSEYLDAINAECRRQGLPTAPEGMENPVLVLRVTGGLESRGKLVEFAERSNRSNMLERSGAEFAESDARRVTPALMRLYRPDASGNASSAGTRFSVTSAADDAAYLDAVRRGDMETARRLLKAAWERSGYSPDTSYKDAHAAPSAPVEAKDFKNVEALNEARDEGWDLNLWAIAKGITGQPDDFFSERGPSLYGYDDAAGRETQRAVAQAIGDIRGGNDKTRVIVYRAVPNDVKLDGLQSGGQWVSPSKTYAENHGKSRFGYGAYRIVREVVRAENLWWDGNDAREWGYDDGRQYVYRNVENGMKLATVTYDDAGNVIPLSQRFDHQNPDIRFSVRLAPELRETLTLEPSDEATAKASVKAWRAERKAFTNRRNVRTAELKADWTKIFSEPAKKKSANYAAHYAAANRLDTLFENGVRMWDESPRNGSRDIRAYAKYGCPFEFGGETYLAKITVKEYADGKSTDGFYSIEAISVEKISAGGINAGITSIEGHELDPGATAVLKNMLQQTPHIVPNAAAERNGGDVRFSVRGLYTGSAADYERPSLHYVGTGEGNQVYGWGLYASNRRVVAESYATAGVSRGRRLPFMRIISDNGTTRNGRGITLESVKEEAYADKNEYWSDKIAASTDNPIDARKDAKKYGREIEKYFNEHFHEYKFKYDSAPGSHLYEQTWFADRAPGDESHLLKWYDAISDSNWDRVIAQAEKEGLREKLKGAWWLRFNGDLERFITDNGNSGDAIYERLSKLLGGPQSASEFLARAGIDGVKYPVDSYGKAVKDGDEAGWNYVSFRDDNVRVDHKWTDGEQRFSVHANPRLREEVEAALNTDRERGDVLKGGTHVILCDPPELFAAIGMPQGTVYTRAYTLRKIAKDHKLTAAQIAETPDLLANPAAVFDDNGEGYIVLTDALAPDLNGRDAPVMVYLRPDESGNYIASAYSKTESGERQFVNLANAGGLLYANKAKAARLPLRGEVKSSLITFNAGDRAEASGDESPSESARIVPQTGVAAQGGVTRLRVFRDENAPATSVTDLTTAFLAQRILAGKKVSVGGAERVLKNVGLARVADAAQVLARAQSLAEDARGRLKSRAEASAPEMFDTLARTGQAQRMVETMDGLITGSAAASDPETGRRLQKAVADRQTRELLAANGFTAAEMAVSLPVDLARAVLAVAEFEKTPEEKARLEAERKRREEKRAADRAADDRSEDERLADVDDPTPVEPTDEQRARYEAVLNYAKTAAQAEREEESRRRAARERRRAERDEENGAADGGVLDDRADDGGAADGDAAQPELPAEAVRRFAPVFEDEWEAAQFIIEWTAGEIVRKHPDLPTTAEMWKSPVAVRELKQTAANVLRRLAKDVLGSPSINYARNLADRIINELESDMETRTYRAVRRKIAQAYDIIHRNALRISRRKLIDRLVNGWREKGKSHPGIRQLAGAKGRFKATTEEFQRKIDGRTELWARKLIKVIEMSDAELAEREAELERATDASPAPEDLRDAPDPDTLRENADELEIIRKYGGLARRMPGEIADAADEILADLGGRRQAFEARRLENEERNAKVRAAIVAAVEAGRAPRRNGREGMLTRYAKSFQGNLLLEMQELVRFCKDPALREAALLAIQDKFAELSEATARSRAELMRCREEFAAALKACYGSAEKGIRHLLSETIPDDVADALFRQNRDTVSTFGNLLQLYAATIQGDYAENARIHGRDKQVELMSRTLTDADKRFHAWAVRWYADNRATLSQSVEAVTGVPVTSPGALYCPVRVLRPREGFSAEASAWSPIPGALSRRVPHTLDFDESANFLRVLMEQAEVRAQTVGYAAVGISLRDTFASREVQEAVRRNVGAADMRAVTDHIRDVLVQDRTRNEHSLDLLNVTRRWMARFAISGNLHSTLVQPASIPVWANVMLGGEQIGLARVTHYMTHVDREAVAELVADDGYAARYKLGWSEAVQNCILNPARGRVMGKVGWAYDQGMKLSTFADRACTLWIAQGFYRDATDHYLRRCFAPDEAKRLARALTWAMVEATQQSGRVEFQNRLQRNSELAKAIFQYKTAQLLANNYLIHAVREAKAGTPGAKGRLLRAIVINTVVVPAYITAIAWVWSLFMGDEPPDEDESRWTPLMKEFLWSMVDNTTAPLFVASSIAAAGVKPLLGLSTWGDGGGIPAVDSAVRITGHAARTLKDATLWLWQKGFNPLDYENEVTTDKVMEDLGRLFGDFAAPVRQGRRFIRNRFGRED